MDPRKSMRVGQIRHNSATVNPQIRGKYQMAWIKEAGAGRIAPIQFLKAMAWVSEHLDGFETTFAVDKPYDREHFKSGLNLPRSHVKGRKQRRRTMTLVAVAETVQGLPVR